MGMKEVAIKLNLETGSFSSSAQTISDAFDKMLGKMKEAQEVGNFDLAAQYAKSAQQMQQMYNGMANGNQAGGGGIAGFNNTVGGISNTAQSVIGQIGAGDAAGGGLTLLGKGAGLLGKLGTGGAIAGAGLLAAVGAGWGVKKLSDLYTSHDDAAEALNASLNNTMRTRFDLSTKEGRGEWRQFAKDYPERKNDFEISKDGKTMIETLESRYKVNTKNIEDAFTKASAAANSFSYSMEDGLSMVKHLTQYGLSSGSYDVARNVFGWSRMMGIQKEEAADFKGTFSRYGNKDADSLAQAYRASSFMGMKEGQYSETLGLLQNIFTDGISKGFTKSIAEIGSTMTFLKNASGNNPLWMGEQGASRYQQLNESGRSATSLSSVSDILTYRAIASLSDAEKARILKEHGLESQGGYLDNMQIAELGFLPEIYKKKMGLFEQMSGKGNKAGMIEMIRKDTGFDYIQAAQFYELMNNGEINKDAYESITNASIRPEYTSRVGASTGSAELWRTWTAELGKGPAELTKFLSVFLSGTRQEEFNTGKIPGMGEGSVNNVTLIKELQQRKQDLAFELQTLYNTFFPDQEKIKENTEELKKINAQLELLLNGEIKVESR